MEHDMAIDAHKEQPEAIRVQYAREIDGLEPAAVVLDG